MVITLGHLEFRSVHLEHRPGRSRHAESRRGGRASRFRKWPSANVDARPGPRTVKRGAGADERAPREGGREVHHLIANISTHSLRRLVTSLEAKLINGTCSGDDIEAYVRIQWEIAERELGFDADLRDARR